MRLFHPWLINERYTAYVWGTDNQHGTGSGRLLILWWLCKLYGNQFYSKAAWWDSKLMDRLIVAAVQERMRVFAKVEHYRHELQRFLRVAQHKHAALVIFPELGGTMLVPPLSRNFRLTLLKQRELGRQRRASFWRRTSGLLAGQLIEYFTVHYTQTVLSLLHTAPAILWQTYCELFSGLAREFQVTLVAPSAYLPDPADGVIRNLTAIFAPNGDLCGYQAKVIVPEPEKIVAAPGADWQIITTPVGPIGLMLGSDALYPEVGRLLAYRGAEILVAQGAVTSTALYQKLRAGVLARMQENQLFAVASFLVGVNELEGQQTLHYAGRSAIFAPQELTPRFNGVLVEMGSPKSEGVLSAEWNFVALKQLWELSDTPVRKELPFKQLGRILESLQARLLNAAETLEALDPTDSRLPPAFAPGHLLPSGEPLLRLDELPITSTITRRWPPQKLDYATVSLIDAQTDMPALTSARPSPPAPSAGNRSGKEASTRLTPSLAEDETEEMDAVVGGQDNHE